MYGGGVMPGRRACRVRYKCNAESPKQDSKRFNWQVRQKKNFAHLGMLFIYAVQWSATLLFFHFKMFRISASCASKFLTTSLIWQILFYYVCIHSEHKLQTRRLFPVLLYLIKTGNIIQYSYMLTTDKLGR